MRRPVKENGLTLIEVLLALALVGLVAAAMFSFYYSGVRAWQKGVDRMDYQQNARAAVDLIDRELRFADWVVLPQEGEIRYKLRGDFRHDDPQYYRRFRLAGEQLLIEEIRGRSTYSYNVVALGMRAVNFSLDGSNNVQITITAGGAGDAVTLHSSVRPRNLPEPEEP